MAYSFSRRFLLERPANQLVGLFHMSFEFRQRLLMTCGGSVYVWGSAVRWFILGKGEDCLESTKTSSGGTNTVLRAR